MRAIARRFGQGGIMRQNLALSIVAIASLLVGCLRNSPPISYDYHETVSPNRPEIGDRIEVTGDVVANPDLRSFDKAMYVIAERRDRAATAAMMSSGEILSLPVGTTGEIIGFPRPVAMDSSSGNLNDSSHQLADARL